MEAAAKAAAKQPAGTNKETLKEHQALWRKEGKEDREELARLTKVTRDANEAGPSTSSAPDREKQAALEVILANIKRFDRRLVESAATTRTIADGVFHTQDVADFFVVRHGAIVVAWTKNRTRTLTVTKASPFATISPNRPDSVATSYGAASLTASLVDMNVALTHTELSSPVFGMVSEATPTAADPNAKTNVIRQTDEEERSGKLAVLVALPIFLRMNDAPWTEALWVGARRRGQHLNARAFPGADREAEQAECDWALV